MSRGRRWWRGRGVDNSVPHEQKHYMYNAMFSSAINAIMYMSLSMLINTLWIITIQIDFSAFTLLFLDGENNIYQQKHVI